MGLAKRVGLETSDSYSILVFSHSNLIKYICIIYNLIIDFALDNVGWI